MMKTKWQFFLFFALGSLIAGASLLALGVAMGGVSAIKKTTAPHKTTVTFDDISSVNLSTIGTTIIKSGNVNKVTATYYTDSKFLGKTTISKKEHTLEVEQSPRKQTISGAIEAFGYWLNESEMKTNPRNIVITIPKKMLLDSISDAVNVDYYRNNGLQLNGITVKQLKTTTAAIYSKNTTIEGGNITNYWRNDFINSQIKNITIDASNNYLNIDHSTLENVSMTVGSGGMDISHSNLNAVTIENNLDYTPSENYYNTILPSINLSKTNIENLIYKGLANISTTDLTLRGNNSFTGDYIDANIDLSDSTKSTTNLSLDTRYGTISLDKALPSVDTSKENTSSFNSSIDNASGQLNMSNKYGSIHIK